MLTNAGDRITQTTGTCVTFTVIKPVFPSLVAVIAHVARRDAGHDLVEETTASVVLLIDQATTDRDDVSVDVADDGAESNVRALNDRRSSAVER